MRVGRSVGRSQRERTDLARSLDNYGRREDVLADLERAVAQIPDLSVGPAESAWIVRLGGQALVAIAMSYGLGPVHPEYLQVLHGRLDGRFPEVAERDSVLELRFAAILHNHQEWSRITRLAFGIAGSLALPSESVLRVDLTSVEPNDVRCGDASSSIE